MRAKMRPKHSKGVGYESVTNDAETHVLGAVDHLAAVGVMMDGRSKVPGVHGAASHAERAWEFKMQLGHGGGFHGLGDPWEGLIFASAPDLKEHTYPRSFESDVDLISHLKRLCAAARAHEL